MTTTITQQINKLESLVLRGDDDKPIQAREVGTPVDEANKDYKYAKYLPYRHDDGVRYQPLTEYKHVDPGLEALKHEQPREFLNGATVTPLSPKFGSEISDLQLTSLDTRGRQQLARYVAERGVVVFRDQDFIDADPDWLLHNWGEFFGRLHIHPVSGAPKGLPEFHLVHRDPKENALFKRYASGADKFSSAQWHSDVTYEKQPPGLTALFLFDSPPSGGDTAYVNQVEAYNRLSPSFRGYLETLEAVHSGFEQADLVRKGTASGAWIKREPVQHTHPIIRKHPVTGAKALFINPGFTRSIVGLKQEESNALLNLLYDHIAKGVDFQVRANWKPRTVVLWDNRVTAHSAIADFDPESDGRRHGARITSQAEVPSLNP